MHRVGEEITGGVQQQSWAHIRSISKPEGKTIEITQMQNVKRIRKSKKDLWDTTKCNNICIIEISEREERKEGRKNIYKNNGQNLSKSKERQMSPHTRKT